MVTLRGAVCGALGGLNFRAASTVMYPKYVQTLCQKKFPLLAKNPPSIFIGFLNVSILFIYFSYNSSPSMFSKNPILVYSHRLGY